jgi:hypothetical protein
VSCRPPSRASSSAYLRQGQEHVVEIWLGDGDLVDLRAERVQPVEQLRTCLALPSVATASMFRLASFRVAWRSSSTVCSTIRIPASPTPS